MKTPKLRNAVEMSELSCDFEVLEHDIRHYLVFPGDYVKVCAEFDEHEGCTGERFWVRITFAEPGRYLGVIDNELEHTDAHGLRLGDQIAFDHRNIYELIHQSKLAILNEDTLRQLLREHITEHYNIVEIAEFEDEFDSSGHTIPHRDSYRRRYEGRLARLREVAPDRTDIHEKHAAILRVLEVMSPSERLYHWTARSQTREYSGAATLRYLVSFFSYPKPSDAIC